MDIQYAISLWNFNHYSKKPESAEMLESISSLGYGVEIWRNSPFACDMLELARCGERPSALSQHPVSLHTGRPEDWEQHKQQIEDAALLNAGVVVVHGADLELPEAPGQVDVQLAKRVVEYASERGIRVALENGKLEFLIDAMEAVENLGVCLDTGHVYNRNERMCDYLNAMKPRLIHLHLQDILLEEEAGLPRTPGDHYTPGTGGIPLDDWRLLSRTLEEIGFNGTGVFEIRPRNPFQTAHSARAFFDQCRKHERELR